MKTVNSKSSQFWSGDPGPLVSQPADPSDNLPPADASAVDALIACSELDEAEALLRARIAAGHADAPTHRQLAALCGQRGRWPQLREHSLRALALDPADAQAHNLLGLAHRQAGEAQEAIACFGRALAIRPAFPGALNNLGIALQELGDRRGAIDAYRRATEAQPDFAEAHSNLGHCLTLAGQGGAARGSLERALSLRPDLADAHNNLGHLLLAEGELVGAIAAFSRAISLQSGHVEAHVNRAQALLLAGDYRQGWVDYDWRLAARRPVIAHPPPDSPRWQGGPLAPGERLLLLAEQGLGDTLQFVRYLPLLRQRGISTQLCAPRELHGLLQASALESQPLSPGDGEIQGQGPWLPLLSLPGMLGVSADQPLASTPYLRPTPERIEHWRQRLAAEPRPLIGLGWQGNPQAEAGTHQGRSFPLDTFAPLAEVTGGTFLSLQKGAGSEQLHDCSFRQRFARSQDEVDASWDFLDSAALVACCDLVISSDSALAHLAGGLGQPTWLLLKHIPDWRWGLEGEESFWYPSLRLFRQRQPGDWGEVMERVAAALAGQALGPILAPVSLGELVDKITILQIKEERLGGDALANVRQELAALRRILAGVKLAIDPELVDALRQTNERLWRIEDDIREQERRQDFGARFVELARSVYQENDRRSALKRRINTSYGSALIEEKSYAAY
jgi:tetratricopeptide (TPR) repeat protein